MTDLSREFEVEPLSEQGWKRVEHRVFDQLDGDPTIRMPPVVEVRRRWSWRSSAALVTVGAVAGVLAFVSLRANDTASLQSSRVATSESPSHLDFGGASLDIAPESELVASGSADHGVLIVLERGSVEFSVEPRRARPPFVVRAGDVRVEVVGTMFAVARHGATAVVVVTKGRVRVVRDGDSSMVGAGERWVSPTLAASAAGDEEIVFGEDETVAFERRRKRRKSARRPAGPRSEPAAEPAVEPEPAQPSPARRFNEAQRLEASNPAAAIAIYGELERGSGRWAANALYAHARLQFDRGRDSAAKSLLGTYVRRYPNGANVRDAEELLARMR